jgi:hypothetical protein
MESISIRPNVIVTLFTLAALLSSTFAQQRTPKIWDIQLGTHVDGLPEDDFVDPACGTNGGAPGLRLGGFEQFEKCRPESSGLYEIWFRYDDELEMIARATRDADAVARNNAMLMLGQPAILSLLIDRAGLVQGYRILTDPRAEAEVRKEAYTLVNAFKARFGATGWDCDDLPPATGETPVDGVMVKADSLMLGLNTLAGGKEGGELFQTVKSIRELAEDFDKRSGALIADGRRTLGDISRAVNNFDRNPSRVIFGGSNNAAPAAEAAPPPSRPAAAPPKPPAAAAAPSGQKRQ